MIFRQTELPGLWVIDLERIEDLLTRETFFEVLRWKRGAFDFRAVAVDHSRRMESLLGAEQILMDGLRMIDEWHSFSELVPSEDTVFQHTAGFEEYLSRTRLHGQQMGGAECVYQLVDGRIPVRRIVDLSLLGSFDAVRLKSVWMATLSRKLATATPQKINSCH